MNRIYQITILGLLIVIAFFLLTKSCGNEKPKPFNYDSLQVRYNTLEADNNSKFVAIKILNKQIESLESIKEKVVVKYITNREKVINNVHDTVSVIEFVNDCDSLIYLNDSIITSERNINDTLSLIIINQQTMLLDKDLIIEQKDLEIKQAKKSLRKQKAKTLFSALISGVIGFFGGKALK